MKKVKLGKYQPSRTLTHELINKLAIIVGHCDLLKEDLPDDSKCTDRLLLIQEVAKSVAEELKTQEVRLNSMMRTPAAPDPPIARRTRL